MVKAVLTDIEGTMSSIAFVTDTLFPYARARLAGWIAAHADEAAPILKDVPGDPVETLTRWIDEDRKETALKTLQQRGRPDAAVFRLFRHHERAEERGCVVPAHRWRHRAFSAGYPFPLRQCAGDRSGA
jgi:hypothetical protein